MHIKTILEETVCCDDTAYIQNAIDHCSRNGGGKIIFKAGKYKCGTIFLRDNVTLQLEEATVISASTDMDDYLSPKSIFTDGVGQKRGRAVIIAENINNVAITGKGFIDGNGIEFKADKPGFFERPFLLRFVNCRKINLENISLLNSAAWTLHLQGCNDVTIKNINIDSRVNHNNDGIDVDSCNNVNISGCNINSHDDAICLKTTTNKSCENINIENCVLNTGAGAVKLGTESYGDIRKVMVRDCVVEYSALGVIKILSCDGSVIEDVQVSGIVAKKTTGPIFIRLNRRGNTYRRGDVKKSAGAIRRIKISKLIADVVVPEKDSYAFHKENIVPARAFSGVIISGIPDARIEDVVLENINIKFYGGGGILDCDVRPDEQEEAYPELFFFGLVPASCFYLRHVESVTFSDVKASLRFNDKRPAVFSDDVIKIERDNSLFPGHQIEQTSINI